jgi:hypothetical protein
MTEHNIKIQDKTFTIGSPSLDKTMRITDYVSEILEEIPGIFDDVETFKQEYKEKHREIITKEDLANPEYKPVLEALNISEDDFNNSDGLVTDEINNRTGIPFYRNPSDFDTIAHVFPKVWKAARNNIVDLCALLTITDGELEEHDKRGAVNGLIAERGRFIRYNASLDELLEIVSVGLIIVKDQIEMASNSLGKVSENLTAMLGGETEEAAQETTEEVSEVEKTETSTESSEDQS